MDYHGSSFRSRKERQRQERRKKQLPIGLVLIFTLITGISLWLSGMYQGADSSHAEGKKEEKEPIESGQKAATEKKSPPKETEKIKVDTHPTSPTVLVNQTHPLPDGYTPPDLVVPDVPFPFHEDLPKKQLRREAGKALEQLFAEAEKQGLKLYAQSGYRSYERQKELFAFKGNRKGGAAKQVSARPGTSEHQTGLAMDITCSDVDFKLEESFAQTKEGRWVAKHAHQYGFIIRYPKGKEEITGFTYEPWHLRYVGKKLATELQSKDWTLEEYYGRSATEVDPEKKGSDG
ncbi:M15 family metallopeptidase [Kroppenstedtia sanguinis]|uniref:D-alanyl-D-alanine carboxypeptidase family protein n=1 Tax=Kroppenstedtia sanguinis TaxID=1380684 RepID=A0ABW4CEN3_9BACL